MTDVSSGVFLGKNQKEIQGRTKNLNPTGDYAGAIYDSVGNPILETENDGLETSEITWIKSRGILRLVGGNGGIYADDLLTITGMVASDFPTSDPESLGRVWLNSGVMTVSAG